MDCLDDDRLLAFVQGDLSGHERKATEAHLRDCPQCVEVVGAFMRLGAKEVEATRVEGADAASAVDLSLSFEERVGGERDPLDGLPSEISGRYAVQDQLGQGGAGAVYRAFDVQLSRAVALKIVRAPDAAHGGAESMQARLLREARAMAQVSHPNVVAVHDVGTVGDRVFIVMELVEGRTLARWLSETARSWRDVVAIFLEAARGVAEAHRVGLVHRDFKPLNVLVGHDGRVRVTDFGLARPVRDGTHGRELAEHSRDDRLHVEWTLTATGGLMGTPRYMAPEQFTHGMADARSDQFSFCVALFSALYGRHPFMQPGAQHLPVAELVTLVVSGQFVAPGAETGIPREILDVLRRGLDPDRLKRHPSMDVLIAELGRGLERTAPRPRWFASWPAGIAAAGIAVGIGIAGIYAHNEAGGDDRQASGSTSVLAATAETPSVAMSAPSATPSLSSPVSSPVGAMSSAPRGPLKHRRPVRPSPHTEPVPNVDRLKNPF